MNFKSPYGLFFKLPCIGKCFITWFLYRSVCQVTQDPLPSLTDHTDKLAAWACILLRLCSPSGLFPGWSRSQTSSQNQLSNWEKLSLELCAENSSIPFQSWKPDFPAPHLPSPCQPQNWPGCLIRMTLQASISVAVARRESPPYLTQLTRFSVLILAVIQ